MTEANSLVHSCEEIASILIFKLISNKHLVSNSRFFLLSFVNQELVVRWKSPFFFDEYQDQSKKKKNCSRNPNEGRKISQFRLRTKYKLQFDCQLVVLCAVPCIVRNGIAMLDQLPNFPIKITTEQQSSTMYLTLISALGYRLSALAWVEV